MRKPLNIINRTFTHQCLAPLALVCVFICIATASCSKDNTVPNLDMQFCDVEIGADYLAKTITLDDGTVLDISEQQIKADTASTTFRIVSSINRQEGGKAQLYGTSRVFCEQLTPSDSANSAFNDPIVLTSVWRAGKYVNFILGIKTTGMASHPICWRLDSLSQRTIYASLAHHQPDTDATSYTTRFYASFPIQDCDVPTTDFDSICIRIPTFTGKGSEVRTLGYRQ